MMISSNLSPRRARRTNREQDGYIIRSHLMTSAIGAERRIVGRSRYTDSKLTRSGHTYYIIIRGCREVPMFSQTLSALRTSVLTRTTPNEILGQGRDIDAGYIGMAQPRPVHIHGLTTGREDRDSAELLCRATPHARPRASKTEVPLGEGLVGQVTLLRELNEDDMSIITADTKRPRHFPPKTSEI